MQTAMRWVQEALITVWQRRRAVGVFLIGWGLVSVAVWLPLTGWGSQRLIALSGRLVVTNEDIAAFLLSPIGLVFLVVGAGLNLALAYVQQAGLFVIASDQQLGARRSLVGWFWHNLKRIPVLAELGLLQLAGFALLLVPFAVPVGLAYGLWLSDHDINYYLAVQPAEWVWTVRLTLVLLALYGLVAAGLFLRWILAVPGVVAGGLRPSAALRASWRATRGNLWSVAAPFVAWWVAWLAASFAVGVLYVAAANGLVDWAAFSLWRLLPVLIVLESVLLVGGVLGAVTGGVVHQFLVARLYWQSQRPVTEPAVAFVPPPRLLRPSIAAVIAVVLIVAGGLTWSLVQTDEPEMTIQITAHRGSSRQAPENTLSAIRQAIADQADYAEIDVQSTKDGQVVMLHDADLMRIAGDPRKVEDLTLVEMERLDIGSWFDPAFKGERIATLEEVIAVARGHIKLNIELKYNRPDPPLADRVLAILRAEDFVSQCVVTSLAAEELIKLEQVAPEVCTGLIVTAALGDYTKLPVDFLSLNAKQVDQATVSAARRQGKTVHVWTVNEPDDALRMIERGAVNLITDKPVKLVALRQQLHNLNPPERLAVAWAARYLL